MKKNYENFKKVKKLLIEKEGIKKYNIDYWEFGKAKKSEIEYFEKYFDVTMPNDLKEFYRTIGGWRVEWTYYDAIKNKTIKAKSLLMPIDMLIEGIRKDVLNPKKGEKHKGILWDESYDENLIKELESFIILDSFGNNYFTLMKLDNQDVPKLFSYYFSGKIYPIKLTFKEYIKYSIEFRYINFWQELFIEEKIDNSYLSQSLRDFKYLFPDSNLLDFIEQNSNKFRELPDEPPSILSDELDKMVIAINKLVGSWKVKFKKRQGCSLTALRKAEVTLNHPLPKSIINFYSTLNGFSLKWKYNIPPNVFLPEKTERIVSCDFIFASLEQLFGGSNGEYNFNWKNYAFEDILPLDKEIYQRDLKFILRNEYNNTAIKFIKGEKEPKTYLLDENNIIPLSLSFTDFIKVLVISKGINYWQRYLKGVPEDKNVAYPPVLTYLETLFSDENISKYFKE